MTDDIKNINDITKLIIAKGCIADYDNFGDGDLNKAYKLIEEVQAHLTTPSTIKEKIMTKKYIITATKIINYEQIVEANSKEEALIKAETMEETSWDKIASEFTVDYAEEMFCEPLKAGVEDLKL